MLCLLYFASVLLRRGTVEVKNNSEQAAATACLLTVAVTTDAQCGQVCGGICYKYSDSIAEHFFVWSVVEKVSSLSAQPAWFLFILIFGREDRCCFRCC